MILSRESIARAALVLLDRDGLDALTMRGLAASLGVQAPALYWHVKNRRDLIDAMGEQIFKDALGMFDTSEKRWDVFLANAARALRKAMLQYHQGGRVLAGTAVWGVLKVTERMFSVMTEGGFTLAETIQLYSLPTNFTVGFVIEEQSRDGSEYAGDNPYNLDNARAMVDPERYPLHAAVLADVYAPDFDSDFEAGLEVILDGLRARLPAKARSRAPRSQARHTPRPASASS